MNRIEINEENVTLLDSDDKIIVTLSDKLDIFDITKVHITIQEDTSISIIHHAVSESKLDITIDILENKQCNLYELKEQNDSKVQYKYYLNKNSYLNIHKFYDCKKVKELDIIELNGEDSKVEYTFHTISNNTQKYDILVYHNAKRTESHIINKGVNSEDGSLVLNVTGIVYNRITDCVIEQNNRIITMNDKLCQINPNLLIEENDVIANHAAHIGRFDKDVIFYLMSRGITYENAISMMVKGFLMDNTIHQDKIEQIIAKYWG